MGLKRKMHIKIKTHKIKITVSPNGGFCIPKKATDQKAFNNNCAAKIKIAVLTTLSCQPACQMYATEMPIKVYKIVHAGANNQLGGLKTGLFKVVYHVSIELLVAMPDNKPTPKQTTIPKSIFTGSESLFI